MQWGSRIVNEFFVHLQGNTFEIPAFDGPPEGKDLDQPAAGVVDFVHHRILVRDGKQALIVRQGKAGNFPQAIG